MPARTHRIALTTTAGAARTTRIELTGPATPVVVVGPTIDGIEPWSKVPLVGTLAPGSTAATQYKWEQVSGTPVVIASPTSPSTFYWAKGKMVSETLEFGFSAAGAAGVWSPVKVVKHNVLPCLEFAARGGVLVPMGMIAIIDGELPT